MAAESRPSPPPSHPRGSGTSRRRRQARWGRRLRRVGLAWQNALEIARAGRLTAPYGHPFEVVHEERIYKLRHYQAQKDPGVQPVRAPLLLVPPLMVASEVYDIAPEVSAVAHLARNGVDVWLVDFGKPEREEGGMSRTLDDHVRAVSEAIERVSNLTASDVHLAGYSQGGMFCYQAAAFRRSANLASIITFGSPVDLHRSVPNVSDRVLRRVTATLRAALSPALSRIEGLPGFFTSTGFKLLSPKKEAQALLDFVKKLHDRQALEKREAKRVFLGGEGFVAWPGPAFQKFVDDMIVANRMASGGFVIDGVTVTLADLACPVLYFVGDRDEMGRPPAVRGIRRAAPALDTLYEVLVKAGHFGLVVGSTAQTITWPTTVEWMRWREQAGPVPARAVDVLAAPPPPAQTPEQEDDAAVDDVIDPEDYDRAFGELQFDLALLQDIAGKTARAVVERVEDWTQDLAAYVDNLRWQVPRLTRLRRLTDDTLISVGRTLAEQAATIPDRTFFLWRGRAFTYAEANRRVEAVVRGLVACGVKPGQRVGVMMRSRPSHLSLVTAINRLGAVSVLMSPDTPDTALARALDVGEVELLITDPDSANRARAAWAGKVLILGGAGPEGAGNAPNAPAGGRRDLPAGVLDMESIDPETVTLPAWYQPDPGRARDLAIVFVTSGRHEPPRAARITNRRWAFSALGAAAACTLTTRDTVYCCLPLHHPAGTLVAAGSALVGGSRLALASLPRGLTATPPRDARSPTLGPETFWDEVRRYGVSVVFYAGEMCRRLVDAPYTVGEKNNPVRLFAGSGMRQDVWRRLVDRFGPVAVLELYASTEASAVLANADGAKVGSVGHPLPGSPELALVAYDFDTDDFQRDQGGRLVRARQGEPGMLIARLDGQRGTADIAHIDPRRLLRDGFAPGDTWFVTGDFMRVDRDGDYWFVDRHGDMIRTADGTVASTRIEDAIYATPGIAMCVAFGVPAVDRESQWPVAAIILAPNHELDLEALSDAVVTLPDYARPRRVRVVDEVPMTDGFRPIKRAIADDWFDHAAGVFAWDEARNRYVPSTPL